MLYKMVYTGATLNRDHPLMTHLKTGDYTMALIMNSGKTFFYLGPRLWNDMVLPAQANAPSLEAFQRFFSK